jgi:hypothetical protein
VLGRERRRDTPESLPELGNWIRMPHLGINDSRNGRLAHSFRFADD